MSIVESRVICIKTKSWQSKLESQDMHLLHTGFPWSLNCSDTWSYRGCSRTILHSGRECSLMLMYIRRCLKHTYTLMSFCMAATVLLLDCNYFITWLQLQLVVTLLLTHTRGKQRAESFQGKNVRLAPSTFAFFPRPLVYQSVRFHQKRQWKKCDTKKL